MNITDSELVQENGFSSVLVVEDHPAERLRLETMLSKIGYRVSSATDGQAALDKLSEQRFDIIVSDWNMPKLDGLNFCREIRGNEKYGYPYFVMLTGFDSKADLIAGMDAGADDFVTKPFNSEELRVRLQAGNRIQQLKSELNGNNENLAKANLQLQQADEEIQQDLKIAAHMQEAMLPKAKNPFPGWSMASLYKPNGQVSGDVFSCFALNATQLGFYHIDVSGQGVAAAMLSFTLARFLGAGDTSIDRLQDGQLASPEFPAEIVRQLNDRFQSDKLHTPGFTMIYGVIDCQSGEGSFCQAGHTHPMVIRASGEVDRLGKRGPAVGMTEDAVFSHVPFHLSPGDHLVTYTDGVIESEKANGQQLGEKQLMVILGKLASYNSGHCIAALDNMLSRWQQEARPKDDLSLMVLGFDKTGQA